jgi:hypothetical protein
VKMKPHPELSVLTDHVTAIRAVSKISAASTYTNVEEYVICSSFSGLQAVGSKSAAICLQDKTELSINLIPARPLVCLVHA